MSTNFASLLYWSRNGLNAGAWLPCMLSLDEDRIELVSERGVELTCASSDVALEFTGWGNLKVVAPAGSFVLSAVGGAAAPSPLPSLEKRLASFRRTHPSCPRESVVDPVTQWQKLLVAAGAEPRGRSRSVMHMMWWVSVASVGAFFAGMWLLIAYVVATTK